MRSPISPPRRRPFTTAIPSTPPDKPADSSRRLYPPDSSYSQIQRNPQIGYPQLKKTINSSTTTAPTPRCSDAMPAVSLRQLMSPQRKSPLQSERGGRSLCLQFAAGCCVEESSLLPRCQPPSSLRTVGTIVRKVSTPLFAAPHCSTASKRHHDPPISNRTAPKPTRNAPQEVPSSA